MKRTTHPPCIHQALPAIPLLALLAACGGDAQPISLPGMPQLALDHAQVKIFRFAWSDVAGETEYRLLENPDGASGFNQVALIPADAEKHDLTVFLPERANARYILQACNASGCTDSAELSVSGNLAQAIGYIKAANAGTSDQFGQTVALSTDGTTLAVGAYTEDSDSTVINGNGSDNSAPDAGAVYLFVKEGQFWNHQAYIKANNTEAGDEFGYATALSADGNTLAVGAPREDGADNGNEDNSGAVYLFSRAANGSWSQQALLRAANAEADDRFGSSLALSGDGATLAVGAPKEDSGSEDAPESNNQVDSGAVYLFTRDGDNWSQQHFLKAGTIAILANFGQTLALDADGDMLAVGTPSADNLAGEVSTFRKTNDGWTLTLTLKGEGAQAGDSFGRAIDLDASGNTLAVGAPGRDLDTLTNSGAVYLFRALENWPYWQQNAVLTAAAPDTNNQFGTSLALSSDGALLAVGALGEVRNATGVNAAASDNSALLSAGAAYLFTNADGAWSQRAYLKASNTEAGDRFGTAVALSGDGKTLAVGATGEDGDSSGEQNNNTPSAGAVYLY